jgi:hypothetical protein
MQAGSRAGEKLRRLRQATQVFARHVKNTLLASLMGHESKKIYTLQKANTHSLCR